MGRGGLNQGSGGLKERVANFCPTSGVNPYKEYMKIPLFFLHPSFDFNPDTYFQSRGLFVFMEYIFEMFNPCDKYHMDWWVQKSVFQIKIGLWD